MYGAAGKRGGAGGSRGGPSSVKRTTVHSTFQSSRPSTAPAGRLSSGGSAAPRNRSSNSGPSNSAASAAEESFSLVNSSPLNYAMIIKLAPDLVEEIKRVEAQGGTARIKFDAHPTNPSGNVIDVGGKDFRFTWAQEKRDLVDIYEERQGGDDGNGLLVESGCAWRKVNVQRVLDESTKNHVKMRSEEAERKQKSRRAIILDHGNPSMKNQVKQFAAVEVNHWRNKQKKEPPPKKRKAETLSVGGPPKSASKSGLASSAPPKVRPSTSPLLSTPEQPGGARSPFRTSIVSKAHASIENIRSTQAMNKENASISEKELYSGVTTGAVQDKPSDKVKLGAKTTDLQDLLISLLIEKPGMNLKALEKAIGDTVPGSVRQIESILEKIADVHAPGRYFLKAGVELDSFKKPSPQNGSSPEDNHHRALAPCNNFDQVPAQEPSFSSKHDIKDVEEQENSMPVEELYPLEKIDTQHLSPDLFGEKKVSDNSEGPAGSSSGTDSDSDSDSSDSGSDSGKSKSRSGSSSDSESDASSNSKEGSDEDVDIMSDDDKDLKQKSEHSEHGLLTSPVPWRGPEGGLVENEVDEKHDDDHDFDIVEIEKDLLEDELDAEIDVVNDSSPNRGGEKPDDETKITSPGFREHQEDRVHTENSYRVRENVANNRSKNEQLDVSERISKSKSKRGSDGKNFDDNPEPTKRLKAENLNRPQLSEGRNSFSSWNPQGTAPDWSSERAHKGAMTDGTNRTVSDTTKYGSKKGQNLNLEVPTKSIFDSSMSAQRSTDLNTRVRDSSTERPDKYVEGSGGSIMKHSERSLQMHDDFPAQKDKVNEVQEDVRSNEKRAPKNSRLGSTGEKHSDSHYRKHGELIGKFKETALTSNSQFKNSPKDNVRIDKSPVTNGRGSMLRRELSDLELGELREPLQEEASATKNQFERKSSLTRSENKSSSDYWNSDPYKGKPAGRTSTDSSKASPPQSNIGISSNPGGLFKKKTPESYVEDSTRPQNKAIQSQGHQLSRSEHVELGFQNKKVVERSSKVRHNEVGVSQGNGVEGYGDTQRKLSVNAGQQQDTKRGGLISTKEDKRQKSNSLADTNEKRNDVSLSEGIDIVIKKRGSSSDEISGSFSKYEKEAAELKGPIKDFSQYKEYVEEYREKYDCYCSLNTLLESHRNEFLKLGKDLELAKGRNKDRYSMISKQILESYRVYGTKHKRLKKIFVVLHEELQNLKQIIKDYAVSYNKN